MPYISDKLIVTKKYDRRYKLTDNQRNNIKRLYKQGLTIRTIARIYQDSCCRRNIQFILFPERAKHVNANSNAQRNVNNKQHAEYMRNHRRYKYNLYKEGKI